MAIQLVPGVLMMSLPTKSEARKIYTPNKIRDVEDHDHDFLVARNGVW